MPLSQVSISTENRVPGKGLEATRKAYPLTQKSKDVDSSQQPGSKVPAGTMTLLSLVVMLGGGGPFFSSM